MYSIAAQQLHLNVSSLLRLNISISPISLFTISNATLLIAQTKNFGVILNSPGPQALHSIQQEILVQHSSYARIWACPISFAIAARSKPPAVSDTITSGLPLLCLTPPSSKASRTNLSRINQILSYLCISLSVLSHFTKIKSLPWPVGPKHQVPLTSTSPTSCPEGCLVLPVNHSSFGYSRVCTYCGSFGLTCSFPK